jgi:hypothetical protein
MDAYEKMGNASKLMKEAFDDLQEMMEELEEQIEMKAKALDAAMKKLLEQERRDYDKMLAPPGNDDMDISDFMDRKHFKKSLINGDDPRFYQGVEMEIRIPGAVQAQRQDFFVPKGNGFFKGEEE